MPEQERFFKDRREAGQQLARQLEKYSGQHRLYVVGLSPAALPIAFEVAQSLDAPLTLLNTRELNLAGPEDMVFGAITSGGQSVINQARIDQHQISQSALEALTSREVESLEQQQQDFLGSLNLPDFSGHTLILVDEGLGHPEKMEVAVYRLRSENPQRIVAALAICASTTCAALQAAVDECVCLQQVETYGEPNSYYEKYPTLGDEQVKRYLQQANTGQGETGNE